MRKNRAICNTAVSVLLTILHELADIAVHSPRSAARRLPLRSVGAMSASANVPRLPTLPTLTPRTQHQQHPAAAAEEEAVREQQRRAQTRRAELLRAQAARSEEQRQRELDLGLLHARSRVHASKQRSRYAEREDRLRRAMFPGSQWPASTSEPASARVPQTGSSRVPAPPASSRVPAPPAPGFLGSPWPASARGVATRPSPDSPASKSPSSAPRPHKAPRRHAVHAEWEALGSGPTTWAVVDILYRFLGADADGASSGAPADTTPSSSSSALAAAAREYVTNAQGVCVPGGLLGLRVACAQCEPHPSVRLFQRLIRWTEAPEPTATQLGALRLLWRWLMPSRARLEKGRRDAVAERVRTAGPKIGAAQSDELRPPCSVVRFEAVSRVLKLLAERRLFERPDLATSFLQRAAVDLKEARPGGKAVIDVEELLLYWTE